MTAQNVSNTIVAATLVTTAETIIGTLPIVAEQLPAAGGFLISGLVNITPGTSTTAITLRVRVGNALAGALVGVADVHTVAAAAAQSIAFMALDPAGPRAGNQYCVTAQQTAASANGTVNDVNIFSDAVTVGG